MAAESKPWFKFSPRDFLADPKVHRMSPAEVGAYLLLLCHAWTDDGLPDDLEDLAFLANVERAEFESMWTGLLGRCWTLDDSGRWRNARLERERADADAKSEKARASASRRQRTQANASDRKPTPANASDRKRTPAIGEKEKEREVETEREAEDQTKARKRAGAGAPRPQEPPPWEVVLDREPFASSPEARQAWLEYHEDRRERGKKATARAVSALLAKLEGHTPEIVIAACRDAIAGGWTGLFPEKASAGPNLRPVPMTRDERNKANLQAWIEGGGDDDDERQADAEVIG